MSRVSQTQAAVSWIIVERRHHDELYHSPNEWHILAVSVFAGFFCLRSKLLLIARSRMLAFLTFPLHVRGADDTVASGGFSECGYSGGE